MPARLEVRRMTALSSAERQDIATILTQAFDRDPLYSDAYPEAGVRRRILHWLFIAAVKDAIRFGRVDIACREKIVGVGINYPPGRYPISFTRNLRCLPEYLRIAAASPFGFVQLYRIMVGFNKVRPARPHSYGLHLGGVQGEFTGGPLMQRWLDEADASHWPCYLETQDRRALKLYNSQGFEILLDGFEVYPGAPLTWTMWREPRGREPPAPAAA